MSFWEGLRQGWDLGIEEGTEDGMRESILEILEARFGNVPWDIRRKLWDVKGRERLKVFLRKASLAGSLEEFTEALEPD